MIRRPLRPLARILSARAEGKDPNLIEAEERAARLEARHRAERVKALHRKNFPAADRASHAIVVYDLN